MPRSDKLVVELRKIQVALNQVTHSQGAAMLRLNALIIELENEPQKWITECVEKVRM